MVIHGCITKHPKYSGLKQLFSYISQICWLAVLFLCGVARGLSMIFHWQMGQSAHISGVLEGMAGRQGSAGAVSQRAYVFSSAWRPQNRTFQMMLGFLGTTYQEIRSYQSPKTKSKNWHRITDHSQHVLCVKQ